MTPSSETVDGSVTVPRDERASPGVVVVFTAGAPAVIPLALQTGSILLGRDHDALRDDDRLSRRHAEVSFDGDAWTIRDLDSRNGTWLDGQPVEGKTVASAPRVVRIGRAVLILTPDTRPFAAHGVSVVDDCVVGPVLHEAHLQIESVAAAGDDVLITGESGTGKEIAARVFHASGPRASGPLVTLNCAAIPEGIAERLLFGAKRGAYSGAADAEGHVQAADRGVLFLDEVSELSLDVQGKLLRVLETREVIPLGGTTARRVDVRFCFATNRSLRERVKADRFRADLYYRIGQPEVVIPPLRERPEEIPWLIAREVARVDAGLAAHPTLIEACILQTWPGNTRELLKSVRRAAQTALAASIEVVRGQHLDPQAGAVLSSGRGSERSSKPPAMAVTREAIVAELEVQKGNLSAAARALGLHRTQLRRLLERFGIAIPKGD